MLPWSWYSDPEMLPRERKRILLAHFEGLILEALA
jgi:hypothetical protein